MTGSSASSYAAIWAEVEDAPCSGSVALADEGLALTGSVLPVGEARVGCANSIRVTFRMFGLPDLQAKPS
jgi:hypothetical protein